MIIKNVTKIENPMIKAAMRASNFDNKKYQYVKITYNAAGLITGMFMIRELVSLTIGNENASKPLMILFGICSLILLYLGMYGMDKNNYKIFMNNYASLVGHKFTYEIDSEEIRIVFEDGDNKLISWENVIKWQEDSDCFFLFTDIRKCIIISKKSFVEGTANDLKQLCRAVFELRKINYAKENEEKNKNT